MALKSNECLKVLGNPRTNEAKYMVLWNVPVNLQQGKIPKRIYCNKIMIEPLTKAFSDIISCGLLGELHSWNGCFNIRPIRGYKSVWSLHSWGIAIDINASTNQLGKQGNISPELVECFTKNGFDWGGVWKRPDPMHFQIKKL
jgi:hypothetical protein